MRRVVAWVTVDGVRRELVFLTNNFAWAAGTVTEPYRCRWQIEVFFKQIKQTLQLADFPGNSANAVRWQVGTARSWCMCCCGSRRFCPAGAAASCGPVVETRRGGAAQKLRDSRGRLSLVGTTGSRVSAGLSSCGCGIATARQTQLPRVRN